MSYSLIQLNKGIGATVDFLWFSGCLRTEPYHLTILWIPAMLVFRTEGPPLADFLDEEGDINALGRKKSLGLGR
jgi:hypothetical protein